MPGELITANWQVELRSTLTGAGTLYAIDDPGIVGLGAPPAKKYDTELGHDDGIYQGPHFTASRLLTIPYVISFAAGTDDEKADDAGAAFEALSEVWATSSTDLELHFRLPGFGHRSVLGRPLGLLDDLSLLRVGVARGFASFECGSPTMLVETGS